ncbi:MAG: nitrophenyl compound nitroreductase subunit ArsF family protein [Candidatus Staskawiczbacteria bacterium]|nr:nitrophenyl compound nitroreductase subunit ArsF family protein [Candidatus Staskawiczbacteria bacterium]
MDKKIIIGVGIIVLILLAVFVIKPKNNLINSLNPTGATKVQVFLFHATQRCPTCISIGRLAKATVEERFAEQLKSGKIEFREINIDLPENKALAEKFQATGSALYINSIKDGQDNIVEDTMVWQLASGYEIKFKDYLSGKLNTILEI